MTKVGGSVRVPGLFYSPKTNLELVELLESYLKVDGGNRLEVFAPQSRTVRPIYKVDLQDVPKPLGALVEQIRSAATVHDAVPGSKHGEDVHGSMRDVHQNNDKGLRYLPVYTYPDPDVMTAKSRAYHDYIVRYEKVHVQNRQRLNSGVSDQFTGYIEYTVKIGQCSMLRLIYDYIHEDFFFSPNHYKPWARLDALTGSSKAPKDDPLKYRLMPQQLTLSKDVWPDNELYGPHIFIQV